MKVLRLIYIANARLPTEKAHGYQICKMCEAFAKNDIAVSLLHPFRYQSCKLVGQTVFGYYSVLENFRVQILPNLDLVWLERFFHQRLFMLLSFVHALIWGLYAVVVARKQGADIYYTRDTDIAFWLVQTGLPTIYEVHAIPKRARRLLITAIRRKPRLKLFVALSHSIKEGLVQFGVSRDKVAVVSHAADIDLFETVPDQIECRRRLKLPSDRPIIGCIGRFQTIGLEKGIPEVVQAMANVSCNGSEPLLLCVGGPMECVPAYLDIARHCKVPEKWLCFLDRVPNKEVPYWIKACDVVVQPLTRRYVLKAGDVMPLKIVEYMAAGVPIVATDLPSIREVLRHGDNAWLVEPDNPEALAQGITVMLEQPDVAATLAARAREDVSRFTWRNRAETLLKDLSEAV